MRFLVDNSLSPRFAKGLNRHGHDAVHVRDVGLASSPDDLVMARAAADSRVLLAEDADFGTVLALRGEARPSVVVFRCRIKSPDRLVQLLTEKLDRIAADLATGSIVVIEDTRIRIRRLPL